MCVTVKLRELKRRMRFCNTYTVDGPSSFAIGGPLVEDLTSAADLLDSFRFGALHPTAVDIGVRIRNGARQAYIVGARAVGGVRRGRKMALRLRLRHVGSRRRSTRTVRIRVPSDARLGRRTLLINGTRGDAGGDPFEEGAFSVVFEDESEDSDDEGPQSPEEVGFAFEALARRDDLRVRFPGASSSSYRDRKLRISGSATVRVRIRRR